jgi:hypothetical protein
MAPVNVRQGPIVAVFSPFGVPHGYCRIHSTGVKLEGPIVAMEQV